MQPDQRLITGCPFPLLYHLMTETKQHFSTQMLKRQYTGTALADLNSFSPAIATKMDGCNKLN